ncbi:hypothetical protein [Stenotrophomonas oahuensis]|uniref:Lipoprotein n=1 Tax=Stenotrophomonas oahuensis TaxID=3003271 RepID=A0ABY9YT14_9GAMM|nr:hypothetical protein [Stenotrophomonas sp. A5586]WNH54085.1 hypothetical protein PDM29_07355 [Stenotrophomonas sp. A5586]
MIQKRGMLAAISFAALLQTACSVGEAVTPPTSHESQVPSPTRSTETEGTAVHRPQPQTARYAKPLSSTSIQLPAEPADPRHLTAEATFVQKGGLASDEVELVLLSREAFAGTVEALEQESVRSIEAHDITRYVRNVIDRGLTSDMRLSSFSCGVSVCMGSVQKGSEFAMNWSIAQLEDDALQFHAVAQTMEKMGGVYENRFVFSTNPELRNFVGPLSQ